MTVTVSQAESVDHAAANGMLRRALQRSEPRRLALMFLVLLIALGSNLARHFLGGKVMQGETFVLRLSLLGLVAVYGISLLLAVRRAIAADRLLPEPVWIGSTVFEALFPTVALFIVEVSGRISPLEALTAPALLSYPVVIGLSILRMRPWLCVLSGVLCAAGHAGLLAWAVLKMHKPIAAGDWAYFASYPVNLAVVGLVSSLVAFEVRKYFRASLREADARQRLALVNKEVEIARVIQQGMMPERPPQIAGVEIAGWNRPADRTGGDYYDWQELPDGRLAVVIADVSGHGLGPALLMAVCRAYARACVPVGPELASALRRVNSLLHDDVSEGRFVTFAIAILDARSGECELLSAGHGPILLYRASGGTVEEFDGDGVPLGVLPDETYATPRKLWLEPGDTLVFVTDGFFEWAAPTGELYGTERLRECVRSSARMPAAEMIARLDADVQRFGAGAPQNDDMIAVIIRRL